MHKSNIKMVSQEQQIIKEEKQYHEKNKYQSVLAKNQQQLNQDEQDQYKEFIEFQQSQDCQQQQDKGQGQDFEMDKYLMTIQQSQFSTYQAKTQETSMLSIQQNNQIDVDLNEIIALYKQIDFKLFDHQFTEKVVIAEKNQFSYISEIEDQRIILQSNSNSTIVQWFLESNNKLIVMKYFSINIQEMLIKKMDEYKIHHKVNKLYLQQSIQLNLPVQVQKDELFRITSCIERAEINLYDYSQNYLIIQEEADIIFKQLLQQIINLHKINVAHRDIKPQNIFYVKEKGWLLSDFGESQEYNNIYDIYDIRGTQYFLKYNIQKQMKFGQCKQNLLQNDLYALLVTIIMIQKQHYIKDIEQEMSQTNNKIYNQILQIAQLKELICFQQNLDNQSHCYQPIIKNQHLKNLNLAEQNYNQKLVYQCINLGQVCMVISLEHNLINFGFPKFQS